MAETLETPSWAAELSDLYLTGTLNTFVLTGEVHELQPLEEDGQVSFVSLKDYCLRELLGSTDLTLTYDRSAGIRAVDSETREDFVEAIASYDALYGTDFAKVQPRDPARALQLLENYLRIRLSEQRAVGLVLDQIEYVAPAGTIAALNAEDRFSLLTLLRWASDPMLLAGNATLILIAGNLADVNERLLGSPQVRTIRVPPPPTAVRERFLQTLPPLELPAELVSRCTMELSLIATSRVLALLRASGNVTEAALTELCARDLASRGRGLPGPGH